MRGRTGLQVTMLAMLALLPAHAGAASGSCERLPDSARRPRPCNPQEECRRLLVTEREARGLILQTARDECARLPSVGTCYGPQVYDPREECRARERR
jgi:hypothetical protein